MTLTLGQVLKWATGSEVGNDKMKNLDLKTVINFQINQNYKNLLMVYNDESEIVSQLTQFKKNHFDEYKLFMELNSYNDVHTLKQDGTITETEYQHIIEIVMKHDTGLGKFIEAYKDELAALFNPADD